MAKAAEFFRTREVLAVKTQAPLAAPGANGRAVVVMMLCRVCGMQNPTEDTGRDCCKENTVRVDATSIKFNDRGEIVGAVYL